jgi:methionyl-tRNA formyltransferase
LAQKLIFAGTPAFAATCLRAIYEAGHDVELVLTQPDRPSGRGQRYTTSAVADVATALGLHVEKPDTLNSERTQQMLRDCHADVMVVVAYGKILPAAVLGIPRHGCLNIHASLLPRWRGAAPIQRAIEAGDPETGICIMQMDSGLDTGPLLMERRVRIDAADTSAALFERLAWTGAEAISEALNQLGNLHAVAQSAEGATYAAKIAKNEAHIDWTQPARVIERKVRAFDPFPGCECAYAETRLKIWRARVVGGELGVLPGTILQSDKEGIVVQCGDDALLLGVLQKPGGRRVAAGELLTGMKLESGRRFT